MKFGTGKHASWSATSQDWKTSFPWFPWGAHTEWYCPAVYGYDISDSDLDAAQLTIVGCHTRLNGVSNSNAGTGSAWPRKVATNSECQMYCNKHSECKGVVYRQREQNGACYLLKHYTPDAWTKTEQWTSMYAPRCVDHSLISDSPQGVLPEGGGPVEKWKHVQGILSEGGGPVEKWKHVQGKFYLRVVDQSRNGNTYKVFCLKIGVQLRNGNTYKVG